MSYDYITVVLKLPKDQAARKKVTENFPIGKDFEGAKVTALSIEDEITVNEFLEKTVDPELVEDARRSTKELHKQIAEAEH